LLAALPHVSVRARPHSYRACRYPTSTMTYRVSIAGGGGSRRPVEAAGPRTADIHAVVRGCTRGADERVGLCHELDRREVIVRPPGAWPSHLQARSQSRPARNILAFEKRLRQDPPSPNTRNTEGASMATTKDYSGALFRNTKKDEGSPNSPDYTGDLLIAGVRYRLAGWIKESKRGRFPSSLSQTMRSPRLSQSPRRRGRRRTTTCLSDVDHRSAHPTTI